VRVFVVIDSFAFGGAENLLGVLAAAAPDAGIELEVASLAPRSQGRVSLLPVLESAGLDVTFLDVHRLADLTAVVRIARAIRASGCDVVHAHLGYSATLVPMAARLAGRPCVSTLHHVPQDLPFRERIKERLSVSVAGRLGKLVFVSDASRREFARRYRERDTWRVLHNGVELSSFTPGEDTWPVELPLPAGAPVCTIVAALREPKGHRTAIDAWPRVMAAVPDARLLIVGDGPERRRLQRHAETAGLAGNVAFAGTRQDVPRLLRASTIAALPSHTEALPTVLIEAAACGRAVVAASVGGVPEVVSDGHTGLLVPPGDTAAFAEAVTVLLTQPGLRADMEVAARRLAEQRFGVDRWAARLRALYEERSSAGAAALRRARPPIGPRRSRREGDLLVGTRAVEAEAARFRATTNAP
jgi:glycosyltransferase involved in cell wall biosynthesis